MDEVEIKGMIARLKDEIGDLTLRAIAAEQRLEQAQRTNEQGNE